MPEDPRGELSMRCVIINGGVCSSDFSSPGQEVWIFMVDCVLQNLFEYQFSCHLNSTRCQDGTRSQGSYCCRKYKLHWTLVVQLLKNTENYLTWLESLDGTLRLLIRSRYLYR